MSEYCVIMAGGSGSRFWPVSRADLPRQFLDLTRNGKSLLQITWERMRSIFPAENILVVTHFRYAPLVREQLEELPEENLLPEPYSRDTAPAVAFAAYTLLRKDAGAVFITVPADLTLSGEYAFREAVSNAFSFAATGAPLIVIGAVPTGPESSCGYIQARYSGKGGAPVKVKTFTERPSPPIARAFFESGEFLWNTEIMVWKAKAVKAELEKHAAEITDLWKGWEKGLEAENRAAFLEKAYADCPRISIGDALLEFSNNVWVLPARFGWSGIENWENLYKYLPDKDRKGNAIRTAGRTLVTDSSGNIIRSTAKDKLIAVHGLHDFVVIDSGDVLMICPREEAELGDFISRLGMPEFEKYR